MRPLPLWPSSSSLNANLAIRVAMDWEIYQMDVKTTLLMEYWRQRSTWINWRGLYKRGKSTICANSRKLCTSSNNHGGHDITVLTHSSLIKDFVRAKQIIRCTSNKWVNRVSQSMSQVGPTHWMAVKRIMKYWKGTMNFKLWR